MKIKVILFHSLPFCILLFLFLGHCDVTPQVHIPGTSLAGATVPLLRYAPLTWQSGSQASWRQPLGFDGPKASQRSIITHKIHFCIDQAKTHREGRFWFDLSYRVMGVHRQMLRIKFCWFLFVFCRKLSHWDLVYKMAGCAARVT